MFAHPAVAQYPPGASPNWQPRPLQQVLNELRDDGLALVYSTNLVPADLQVRQAPGSSRPIDRLREVLAPHDLAVQVVDGIYLVVRALPQRPTQAATGSLLVVIEHAGQSTPVIKPELEIQPPLGAPEQLARGIFQFNQVPAGSYSVKISSPGYITAHRAIELQPYAAGAIRVHMRLGPAELEQLSISASRYILFSNSQFFIDQRAIQALPDLGEDPVRSAHRLPGSAAGGLSSQTHFRGGEHNETAIFLNGLQLTDPFHIRDFHNIFSSLDARAIAGVEAYTGGFPVNYGDSMSGVLLLESQRPDRPRRTELGLSIYNSSVLFSGLNQDETVDWLLSGRRSNLSLILNNDLGKPDYFDVFAELGFTLSDTSRLSINALYADDQVVVITESDPAELEKSDSKTRNRQIWMLLENQWTARLASTTVLSSTRLENDRLAQVNDPEQFIGSISDHRTAELLGIRQDWRYTGPGQHEFHFGVEFRRQKARYRYQSQAEYFEFYEAYPGLENPVQSDLAARPDGNSYSLFLSDRWHFSPTAALQWGLRWDKQTYTQTRFKGQLSPRLSLLKELGKGLDLRLTWGRYHQSQPIQQLQVEDGLTEFFPAQRADHWIAGVQYRSEADYRFRAEAFVKDYSRLKPRFENLFDALALIPELEPDRVRLDPESALAKGLELTVEYRGERAINWWLTWSWAQVSDSINGRKQWRSWDQRHAFQGGMAWQHGPWETGLALSVHSGWPTTGMQLGHDAEEDEYFPLPGVRNANRLGTFATLDFRVSRRFATRNGEVSAFFEVTNASNRKNDCCVDYDTEEDEAGNVFLDRSVDHWLPLVPAIGVLWEF